jgi:hypothetical protein
MRMDGPLWRKPTWRSGVATARARIFLVKGDRGGLQGFILTTDKKRNCEPWCILLESIADLFMRFANSPIRKAVSRRDDTGTNPPKSGIVIAYQSDDLINERWFDYALGTCGGGCTGFVSTNETRPRQKTGGRLLRRRFVHSTLQTTPASVKGYALYL